MRATRDLLRRRNHLVRKRAELITHIQNTNSQYNLPPFEARASTSRPTAREAAGALSRPAGAQLRGPDLALIEQYDALLPKLERHIQACAKGHDRKSFVLLRSIPGVGLILALVMLYEIQRHRAASPGSRTSCPTPGWSAGHASRPARSRGMPEARSATPT